MTKRTLNFWIIALVGILAFGWMLAELLRVLGEIRSAYGMQAIPSDGVIQHKVGELMVGVPFVAILALSNVWPKRRVLSVNRGTFVIMLIGGLLNAIAWYSLADRVAASDFLRA